MPFAPLLIGIASAFAQFAVLAPDLNFLYWQGPFMFTALGSVAVAFACRPVLSRIPWSRGVAVGLALGLLAGVGLVGDWAAAWITELLGLGTFPLQLPTSPLPLVVGTVVAAVMMGWLYPPAGGEVTLADLKNRFDFLPLPRQAARLALAGAVFAALLLGMALIDARMEEASDTLYIPLLQPNHWLRLEGIWQREAAPSGPVGAALLVAVLWLRGLMVTAPLVPIALVIRGSRFQLTVMFALLLFVVGDFAPLMSDQPYPSLSWLTFRTGVGLLRAVLLGAAMTALFGLVRGKNGNPPASAPSGGQPAPVNRQDDAGDE